MTLAAPLMKLIPDAFPFQKSFWLGAPLAALDLFFILFLGNCSGAPCQLHLCFLHNEPSLVVVNNVDLSFKCVVNSFFFNQKRAEVQEKTCL